MGLLDKLAVGGVVALIAGGVTQAIRAAKETKRRINSPIEFDQRLTADDFADIVDRVAKKTPRLTAAGITGLVVEIHIRSNSGLTNWTASIDFNDYGRPTGRYWMASENSQSPLPKFFADSVRDEINLRLG